MVSVLISREHKKKLFNQVKVNQSVPVLFTKNGSKGTVAKVTKTDASIDGINIILTNPQYSTSYVKNFDFFDSLLNTTYFPLKFSFFIEQVRPHPALFIVIFRI